MYLGSVRFFKHVIYGVLLLILLLFFALIANVFNAAAVGNPQEAYPSSSIEKESVEFLLTSQKIGRERPKASIEITQLSSAADDKAEEAAPNDTNIPYPLQYPDLYSEKSGEAIIKNNTVYLTFDDGPSSLTLKILKILKENNVKATFFVVGKADETSKNIMKQIADEGHTIGVHSYTHDYAKIYSSVAAYLEDFNNINNLIYEAANIKPSIFRFPGGSINSYNGKIYKDIIKEMNRRGFTYYDWNVSAVDTVSDATAKSIYHNITGMISQNSRSIVLLHDSEDKRQTVDALDGIIKDLKKQGFTFDSLTNKIKPIVF